MSDIKEQMDKIKVRVGELSIQEKILQENFKHVQKEYNQCIARLNELDAKLQKETVKKSPKVKEN